jgi:hypothetical protein
LVGNGGVAQPGQTARPITKVAAAKRRTAFPRALSGLMFTNASKARPFVRGKPISERGREGALQFLDGFQLAVDTDACEIRSR